MGIEEKNKSEALSRIVSDLFATSRGGEEQSSRIQRLRDELKKVIEGMDTIYGKFRELVESFREIIPEEKQRYNAAIKALSTTSRLSRQEIVKAVNSQLEELKILEKGLLPPQSGWRGELKAMETRSQEIKSEIVKLREKIALLESEEKGLRTGMAGREKEIGLVEKAVGKLFTDIGAEMTSIRNKIEEFIGESAASRPIQPKSPAKSDIPIRRDTHDSKSSGFDRKIDVLEPRATMNTEFQKKCPMCGGQMSRLIKINEEIWQCYSCAYEESKEEMQKDIFPDTSEELSEQPDTPEPAPDPEQAQDPTPSFVVPLASMSSSEDQKPKKGISSTHSHLSKKKACPACRKKMNWYYKEQVWRCPFCQYEIKL